MRLMILFMIVAVTLACFMGCKPKEEAGPVTPPVKTKVVTPKAPDLGKKTEALGEEKLGEEKGIAGEEKLGEEKLGEEKLGAPGEEKIKGESKLGEPKIGEPKAAMPKAPAKADRP